MATTTYTLNVNHAVPGRDGGARTELADSLTFTVGVSGAVPAVSGVAIASSPADGSSYATDENIDVEVTFNYPVTVTGTPRLALGIGSATRQAAYRTHSGSTASFRYQASAADIDRDGISIAADALTLNGGGIEGLERRRGPRPRRPCHRERRRPPGERSPALLRGGGGEPALRGRHGREPATAGGDRRRRHGEPRADRAGHGDDALPAPGALLERRHAHDLGHARRSGGGGLLHADRHRRRRRHGAAVVRHHGGGRPTRPSRRLWRCPLPWGSTATTPRGRWSGRSSRSTRTSP